MPSRLPQLRLDEFAVQIRRHAPSPLSDAAVEALYAHYRELCRWNERLSLIGPGTLEEVVSRHYGEALAALPLLEDLGAAGSEQPQSRTSELLDIGSGAGFPGIVLAAARADIHVTLVESRQRKWSFLRAATRKAGLPCQCLDARVNVPLPAGIPAQLDVVTLRAIKLNAQILDALCRRLRPAGRFLLWVGQENPDLPAGLTLGRTVHLPGSRRRRILELRRIPSAEWGSQDAESP